MIADSEQNMIELLGRTYSYRGAVCTGQESKLMN